MYNLISLSLILIYFKIMSKLFQNSLYLFQSRFFLIYKMTCVVIIYENQNLYLQTLK